MSDSHLIPNSFQKPNILTDKLAYYLTPEENTVLDKAVREILGWRNKIEQRKAAISLSVFVDGKFIDGVQVAWGCGLGIAAVRSALKELDKYKVLEKVGKATGDGQLFWLQDDSNAIDWAGLEDRKYRKDTKKAGQTEKARGVLLDNRGVLLDSTTDLLLNNMGGVLLDSNKETQEKPIETQLYTRDSEPARNGTQTPSTNQVPKPPLTKQFVIIYGEQTGQRVLPAHKKTIEKLALSPGATLAKWQAALEDCVLSWSGNGSPPLERIIAVYTSGLTYREFIKETYNGNGNGNGAKNNGNGYKAANRQNEGRPKGRTGEDLAAEPYYDPGTHEHVFPDGRREPAA